MKKFSNSIFLLCFLVICLTFTQLNVLAASQSSYTTEVLSGQVTTSGAISGTTSVSASNLIIGDLDGDGQVTSTDYALMKKYLLGQIKHFPIEGKIISSVNSFSDVTINQGDDYKLPTSVTATMQDGSQKDMSLTWSPSVVDTSRSGVYRFEGTIDGYSSKVNLTLIINSTTAESMITEIVPISLNQFKVVFNTSVDEDSAENVFNYQIDGTTLTPNYAVVSLQEDKKTVVITLTNPIPQNHQRTITVKNSILDEELINTIPGLEQQITFIDSSTPTLQSITVTGNSKIKVMFSEPIRIPVDGSGKATSTFTSKFKINGLSLFNFGLSTASPVDAISADYSSSSSMPTNVWADGITLYFLSGLPSGNNTLQVTDGDVNGALCDAAGFTFRDTTKGFAVDSVTTAPVVKEVTVDSDGTLWVRFDRPMDRVTATNYNNYGLNTNDNITGGLLGYGALKESDCTIKFYDVAVINGTNNLYISSNVKDAYGNKVADNTRISFNYVIDETKPTVTNASIIDSSTIRITFSKDIDVRYATQINNYTLKDSGESDITMNIGSISSATGAFASGKVWDIRMLNNNDCKLTGSMYTIMIKNMIDTTVNANIMDDFTTTLTGIASSN